MVVQLQDQVGMQMDLAKQQEEAQQLQLELETAAAEMEQHRHQHLQQVGSCAAVTLSSLWSGTPAAVPVPG